MDPVTIATLIANLLPSLLTLYSAIQKQNSGQVAPLEDILKAADANWDAIAAAAKAELDKQVPPAV